MLEALGPSTDREELEAALTEVAEAMRWLGEANSPGNAAKGSAVRFTGLPDVEQAVGRLRIEGAGLEPHLEAFMWEILKAIQVKVNKDGLKMLLGA